ncbi:MAG: hypothetical protein A3B89_01765 [Candidatus Buchananbacteria bacterium RIFCSPHIGHO2_02_FULL_40_13]|uniref:Uncharacterized protein n=1 Tax=Candidatus Buchananbacteria bacterium RIFCSPLOWO2_01_FULL_39_33 TaxID=1797543 RepID=A0A1G1YIU9_9BACT|nr:MAG: hypothetical protein A3B89_01765 [Candidatus Buchananbacteria bacterium RIFCSPHIGHO2_02_FULL_40_13]OGY52272.1 MAG: hypothetical protein A3A02_01720 [Candidatus Buchananbacteria bacterium RIFCSPLOWO2_01_FULL_39_33]
MEKIKELEKLKNEILSEVGLAKKESQSLPWNSLAVYVVLIVLTFFSIAQTVQSAVILNKIKSGNIQTANSSTNNSSAPLPDNLQNLPDMVGGC